MTVTDILYTKGWLLRKQGHAWLYAPVRSREAYAAALREDGLGEELPLDRALRHFVENMSRDKWPLRQSSAKHGPADEAVNAAPVLWLATRWLWSWPPRPDSSQIQRGGLSRAHAGTVRRRTGKHGQALIACPAGVGRPPTEFPEEAPRRSRSSLRHVPPVAGAGW